MTDHNDISDSLSTILNLPLTTTPSPRRQKPVQRTAAFKSLSACQLGRMSRSTPNWKMLNFIPHTTAGSHGLRSCVSLARRRSHRICGWGRPSEHDQGPSECQRSVRAPKASSPAEKNTIERVDGQWATGTKSRNWPESFCSHPSLGREDGKSI